MKSKWITVLLITSICVNLALAGYIVGNRSIPGSGFDPTRSYPRWARMLPPERREVLWPLMREQRTNMRPTMRALRKKHRELRSTLTKKPFNRDTLAATLQEIRTQLGQVQSQTHAGFIEFVTHLSDEERDQLAADMAHRKHRRPPPRHAPNLEP